MKKKNSMNRMLIAFLKERGFKRMEQNHYADDFYSIVLEDGWIDYSNGDNSEGSFDKDLYTLAGWYYLTYSKISLVIIH